MSDLSELVNVLHPKTMEGRLKWNFESDSRILSVQGANIIEILDHGSDGMGVSIRNRDGVVIAEEDFDPFIRTFDKLNEIFRKAKRDHFKVDEALSDLKSRLEAL